MPLDLNYKNAGAWGPGLGRKLTGVEVDTNFHEVEVAVEALETSRPQPNNITSITTDSTSITFHFQDGTSIGPVPLPILEFRYRGEWAPSTLYQVLDVFIVTGTGEFSVLVDHTSAAVFDEAATDPGGAGPLYLFMLPMGSGESLESLSDVAITAPQDGQILRYDTATATWINRDLPALDELADVVITAAVNNQALVWDTATSTWVNRTPTLAALGDVHLAALADQQMLAWHASASAWVNVNPPSGGGGGSTVLLYRGIWITTGVYAPNDVVRDGAAFFACWLGVGHSALRPGADGAHWSQLSAVDSAALDGSFGAAPGTLLHRDIAGWLPLAPGAAGTFLKSQGAGLPLVYDAGLALGGATDKQYARYDAGASAWVPSSEGWFRNAAGLAVVTAVRGIAPIAAGDQIAGYVGAAFDGTAVAPAAAGFFVEAVEAWNTTRHGSRLVLETIPAGSLTTQRSLAVEGDGGLYTPGVSGGSRGAGTVNLTGGFYVNGAPLSTAGSLGNDLDTIGSTRGSVLFRGASAWQALTPGTNGQVLMSGGPGANPSWGTGGGGTGTLGGLVDVTLTAPVDKQYLRFDGSSLKWVNTADGWFDELQVQGFAGSGVGTGFSAAPASSSDGWAIGANYDPADIHNVDLWSVHEADPSNDSSSFDGGFTFWQKLLSAPPIAFMYLHGSPTFTEFDLYLNSGTDGTFYIGASTADGAYFGTTGFTGTNDLSLLRDGEAQVRLTASGPLLSALTVQQESSPNGTPGVLQNYAGTQSAVTSFPIFATRQARGTGAAPAAVHAGDVLGASAFYGHDGSGFRVGASIQASATETWGGSARGSKLLLGVTPNGTTAPIFPLGLEQDGGLVSNAVTGGSKGPGTINVAGLFVNGAAASVGGGAPGALTLISTLTASNSATLDFTGLTATTDYVLVGRFLLPVTNNVAAWVRYGSGSGPTWMVGNNYRWAQQYTSSIGTTGQAGGQSDPQHSIVGALANAGIGVGFTFDITSNNTYVLISGNEIMDNQDGNFYRFAYGGRCTLGAAVTGIRFMMSSGNIASGTLSLYSRSR
jgi:hypothetical protein